MSTLSHQYLIKVLLIDKLYEFAYYLLIMFKIHFKHMGGMYWIMPVERLKFL